MSIFDKLFKGKTDEKPAATPTAAAPSTYSVMPDPEPQPPIDHTRYSKDDIEKFVCDYIDEKGINGLSKEETELAKPFFVSLFYFYHDNAVKNNHAAYCDRDDYHELWKREPVFLTASRVLCDSCALQYIIGNQSDWHYYLGNISAAIGAVPAHFQAMGNELKKQISDMREKA